MVDERAQAVSIAYRYFVLADRLLPGFKDHLAKHVRLDWFGRNIKGRNNVANFMLSDKKTFTHTFADITPTSYIGWEKQEHRKRKWSLNENIHAEETSDYDASTSNCPRREASCDVEMSTTHEDGKNFTKFEQERETDDANSMREKIDAYESPACMNVSNVRDYTNDHVDKNRNDTNATTELNAGCYDLNEDDLRNLSEAGITSQTVEEIQNINRVELKEEMAPTVKPINKEREQQDRATVTGTGTLRYLEAIGKIHLLQTFMEDSAFGHYWPRRTRVWKQKCKVQIAYSILKQDNLSKTAEKDDTSDNVHSNRPRMTQSDVAERERDMEEKRQLPYVEEFVRANVTSIPDVNYFGGYLRPIDFSIDREEFLRQFETEMKQKNPEMRSSVRYEGNRLIFNYPNRRSFQVTCQIHMIVYTKIRPVQVQAEEAIEVEETEEKEEEEDIVESIRRFFQIEE